MRHRRGGKTVDYKAWIGHTGAEASFSTDAVFAASGSLSFTGLGTILRAHYPDLLVHLDSTKQVGDNIVITLGLGIISTDAAAQGANSFPDPVGSVDYPWLMWDQFSLDSEVAAGEEAIGASVVRRSYDVKAMRRVKPGETLIWVGQRSGASGAPVTLFKMSLGRVLIGT